MERVVLYGWPESQECLECEFSESLMEDSRVICHLNHDKLLQDKCSHFFLLQQTLELL